MFEPQRKADRRVGGSRGEKKSTGKRESKGKRKGEREKRAMLPQRCTFYDRRDRSARSIKTRIGRWRIVPRAESRRRTLGPMRDRLLPAARCIGRSLLPRNEFIV